MENPSFFFWMYIIMYACIRHRLMYVERCQYTNVRSFTKYITHLTLTFKMQKLSWNSLETLKRCSSSLRKRQIQNCTLQYCSTREHSFTFFLVTVKILQLDWFIIVFVCSKCMHCRWRDANFRVNFEQGGILIVPNLASSTRSHPKERPSSYNMPGVQGPVFRKVVKSNQVLILC